MTAQSDGLNSKGNKYAVGTLRYLAKERDPEKYNKTKREQQTLADAFDDGMPYPVIDIGTPFLRTESGRSNERKAEGVHTSGS